MILCDESSIFISNDIPNKQLNIQHNKIIYFSYLNYLRCFILQTDNSTSA